MTPSMNVRRFVVASLAGKVDRAGASVPTFSHCYSEFG